MVMTIRTYCQPFIWSSTVTQLILKITSEHFGTLAFKFYLENSFVCAWLDSLVILLQSLTLLMWIQILEWRTASRKSRGFLEWFFTPVFYLYEIIFLKFFTNYNGVKWEESNSLARPSETEFHWLQNLFTVPEHMVLYRFFSLSLFMFSLLTCQHKMFHIACLRWPSQPLPLLLILQHHETHISVSTC